MMQTSVVRVTGIDGCRGGWVAVVLADGEFAGHGSAPSLAGVLAKVLAGGADPGAVVGIDMVLGVMETAWRAADGAARRLLGARHSTVFAVPPRPVWEQDSYADANRVCRELTAKGFSVQAWQLRAKLLETAAYRQTCGHRLYEVHPELAFMAMAGGQALAQSKHTAAGRERRRELLTEAGIAIRADPLTADLLDAAAVAWSALRIANGTAVTLPDPPQHDRDGLEVAIRY
jgi:predicted RNase H-like nuclease